MAKETYVEPPLSEQAKDVIATLVNLTGLAAPDFVFSSDVPEGFTAVQEYDFADETSRIGIKHRYSASLENLDDDFFATEVHIDPQASELERLFQAHELIRREQLRQPISAAKLLLLEDSQDALLHEIIHGFLLRHNQHCRQVEQKKDGYKKAPTKENAVDMYYDLVTDFFFQEAVASYLGLQMGSLRKDVEKDDFEYLQAYLRISYDRYAFFTSQAESAFGGNGEVEAKYAYYAQQAPASEGRKCGKILALSSEPLDIRALILLSPREVCDFILQFRIIDKHRDDIYSLADSLVRGIKQLPSYQRK